MRASSHLDRASRKAPRGSDSCTEQKDSGRHGGVTDSMCKGTEAKSRPCEALGEGPVHSAACGAFLNPLALGLSAEGQGWQEGCCAARGHRTRSVPPCPPLSYTGHPLLLGCHCDSSTKTGQPRPSLVPVTPFALPRGRAPGPSSTPSGGVRCAFLQACRRSDPGVGSRVSPGPAPRGC